MHIWVDADACPKVIKEILYRAAERTGVAMTLVANQPLTVPRLKNIRTVRVGAGFDVADNEIVRRLEAGDLVITADIPLADRIVAKGAIGLDPRGTIYNQENIKSLLAMRNLMQELRDGGEITGGPSTIGEKEKRAFADGLNMLLQKHSIPC